MQKQEGLESVAKDNPLAERQGVSIEDLRDQKIIAFARNNLSYTERYFSELFEEHDLSGNIAYSCDDTFSVISLVSALHRNGFSIFPTADSS
jgi:DNA-binding transcriptional LysR family regulator